MQALAGEVLLPEGTPQPCWLKDGPGHADFIAVENGILDVRALFAAREKVLLSHTPRWFSPVCLPYGFDPAARCPKWDAFLARNLRGDKDKVRLLQQFAGYLLLPDTSLQRLLM